MKERPILFSGVNVLAILEGRKTQTRRVMKPQPGTLCDLLWWSKGGRSYAMPKQGNQFDDRYLGLWDVCPYGRIGDRLWVRENFHQHYMGGVMGGKPCYQADRICQNDGPVICWKPSIHMPRWASRINLEVVKIRVERLQEISEADARAEGTPADGDFPLDNEAWCPVCYGQGVHGALGENLGVMEVDCDDCNTPKKLFRNIWNSINAKRGYSWESNPWVWVIEFRRVA